MAPQSVTTLQTPTGDVVQLSIFSALSPAPPPPPCLPPTTLPPLIYHITLPHGVTTPTTPYTFLTQTLSLPSPLLTQATTLGGVYLHTPRPRASPRAARASLQTLHAELPLHKRVYIRLHLHPKRYPTREYDLLAEEDGVLCFYKPPELPVCAGVDNAKECLASLADACVTNRIDVGTSGIVLMTRDRRDVQRVNAGLKAGSKYYIVFTELRGGGDTLDREWRDWYRSKPELSRGARAPVLRRFEEGGMKGWVEARLEIVERRVARFAGGKGRVFVVRLCTGRTHQIRVQMAARGYWVVGDGKYEGVVGGTYEDGTLGGDARRLGLHCWLVFCGRWWSAGLARRRDLCGLVEGDNGFWEWLGEVETRLRDAGVDDG